MTRTASLPRGETTEIFIFPLSMKYTASDFSPCEKIRVPFGGVIVLLPVVIACSNIATCEWVLSALRDSFFFVFGTIETPELVFDTHRKGFDNSESSQR